MITDINTVIAEWTARLDEQERVARETLSINVLAAIRRGEPVPAWTANIENGMWVVSSMNERPIPRARTWAAEARHIALHDPASVLEDIGRKRRIIEQYREAETAYRDVHENNRYSFDELFAETTLRALELVIRTLAGATEETT